MGEDVEEILERHGVDDLDLGEELVRAYLDGETTFRTVASELSISQDETWSMVEDVSASLNDE